MITVCLTGTGSDCRTAGMPTWRLAEMLTNWIGNHVSDVTLPSDG